MLRLHNLKIPSLLLFTSGCHTKKDVIQNYDVYPILVQVIRYFDEVAKLLKTPELFESV